MWKDIMASIEDLRQQKTVIIIAHRLTTVKHCDVIFVMDQGKVIDSGSFAELQKRSALFRSLSNHMKGST